MKYVGLDDLREWLSTEGFQLGPNQFASRENECNWYAWRRSEIEARRCECNDDKQGVQIVVTPHRFDLGSMPTVESVEVDITGEADGRWHKIQAYGIKPDDLKRSLPDVEAALIRAWNALANW